MTLYTKPQPDSAFVDITNPDTYINGVPHETFKYYRDNDPVHWVEEKDGSGFWAITRYDDVITVSHNPKIFSSSRGIRLEEMKEDELIARRTMMEIDPPEHTSYRRLVGEPFAKREVLAVEEGIRLLARAVIDQLDRKQEFDFVVEIARQLPMRMLGRLLGVPEADGPWMVRAGDALIGNADPEFTDHPVDLVDTDAYRLMPFRSPVSKTLFDYAAEQARIRREHPSDDLISRLLQPKRDGEVLSEEEFKNFFTLLVAAGNDTTRYTMAAGILALIEHPSALVELRADPALIPSAVEEILRWGTVTMHFRRTAMDDVELGGKQIKKGDKVVLWYISADFDERRFPDPYTFDIHRDPNDHVAFGLQSPHKCLGEHLARVEIKVLLEELLPRLEAIQLNGRVERLRSNFISGIKHLPVKVKWV